MKIRIVSYSILGLFLLTAMPLAGQGKEKQQPVPQAVSQEDFNSKMQDLRKDRDKNVPEYAGKMVVFCSGLTRPQLQLALSEAINFCGKKNNGEALNTLSAIFLDPAFRERMAFDDTLYLNLVSQFIYQGSAGAFDQAAAMYQKHYSNSSDDGKKVSLLTALAKNALVIGNTAGFDKAYTDLLGLQSSGKDAAAEKRLRDNKINQLCSVLELLADKDFVKAENAAKDPIFADSFYATRYALAAGAVADLNRAGLDKMIAEISAMPDSPEKTGIWFRLVEGPLKKTPLLRQKILKDMQGMMDKLTAEQQIRLLTACRPALPGIYGEGLKDETGIYTVFKDYSLKAIEVAVKNGLDKNVRNVRKDLAIGAWRFGDYQFLNDFVVETLQQMPDDVNLKTVALQNAIRSENWEAAEQYLSELSTVKRFNELDKKAWQGLIYLGQSGKLSKLDKKIYGSKWKEVSLKDRFALRRRISRFAVICQHYSVSQNIFKEIMKDFFKDTRTDLHYTVKYQKNAPKNAAAWAASDAFREWRRMETRLIPLDMYFQNAASDEKFLKDVPDHQIKPETKNGIQLVYDLDGVHLYARAEDPDIEAVRLGKKESPSFECFIRPGQDSTYSWFFFAQLPDCTDSHAVQWNSPGKDYKLTYDFLKKDACLTDSGYALHAFIPWEMFLDKLPLEDRQWSLGFIGNGGSVNGYVHELERALKLDFDIPKNIMIRIMKNTGLRAFYRYQKVREPAYEFIRTWESDKELGDADFYARELASFIQELDDAGARLEKSTDANEIKQLYTKYAPLWHNIRYEVSERRTNYLRKKILFGESQK